MHSGRDDQQWDQLIVAGLEFLIDRARLKVTSSYTELNTVLARRTGQPGFDFVFPEQRAAMGHLLGAITRRHRSTPGQEDLMISAVVQYLNANDAGPGFYTFAEELGRTPGALPAERERFWSEQLTAVFTHHARTRRHRLSEPTSLSTLETS